MKSSSNVISLFEGSITPERLKIEATCTGCGRCVAACPVHALTLVTERADGFGRKTAMVAPQRCTGCGNCLPACPHHALHLLRP